jgi:hypothetical protein
LAGESVLLVAAEALTTVASAPGPKDLDSNPTDFFAAGTDAAGTSFVPEIRRTTTTPNITNNSVMIPSPILISLLILTASS